MEQKLQSQAYTAHWVRPLRKTCQETARLQSVGPTARAISGYLAATAQIRLAGMALSTTFGSTIRPPTNGHGWAETARSPAQIVTRPVSMAAWVRQPLGTFPVLEGMRSVGPTAMEIFGSSGGLALIRPVHMTFSTT